MTKKIIVSALFAAVLLGGVQRAEAMSFSELIEFLINAGIIAQNKAAEARAAIAVGTGQQSNCHMFNSNFGVGSGGPDVAALGKILAKEGLRSVAGNSYDEEMAASVVSFQARYGIPSTGYVGPLTRAHLNQVSCSPASSSKSAPAASSIPASVPAKPAATIISAPVVLAPAPGSVWDVNGNYTVKIQFPSQESGKVAKLGLSICPATFGSCYILESYDSRLPLGQNPIAEVPWSSIREMNTSIAPGKYKLAVVVNDSDHYNNISVDGGEFTVTGSFTRQASQQPQPSGDSSSMAQDWSATSFVGYSLVRDLSIGSLGRDVAILQDFLWTKSFLQMSSGVVHGSFDQATADALSRYQVSVGLSASGSVGSLTRASLNTAFTSQAPNSVAVPASNPASSPMPQVSCPQSVSLPGFTLTLEPCEIVNASLTDEQGDLKFKVRITASDPGASFSFYASYASTVGFPPYSVLMGSGATVGGAEFDLTFVEGMLSANGSEPRTYSGYLPITVLDPKENKAYLYMRLNLTVNPAN
ncbi:MAG TPA: peptidoglycan-binding domain-containing protein [Candidatus Paceibacterota bacterium]